MQWDKVAINFLKLARAKPFVALFIAVAAVVLISIASCNMKTRTTPAPQKISVKSEGSNNQNAGTNSGTMNQTNK